MTHNPKYMTDLERINFENKGYPMPKSTNAACKIGAATVYLILLCGSITFGIYGMAVFIRWLLGVV